MAAWIKCISGLRITYSWVESKTISVGIFLMSECLGLQLLLAGEEKSLTREGSSVAHVSLRIRDGGYFTEFSLYSSMS